MGGGISWSSSGWAGRASEGCGLAGRPWVGWRLVSPSRGCSLAGPKPPTTCTQNHLSVSFVLPYARLWLSSLVASPSAGARIPSTPGTALKGTSASRLIGGAPNRVGASAGPWGQWKSWLSESGSSSCLRAPS